jgi:cytochrome P450
MVSRRDPATTSAEVSSQREQGYPLVGNLPQVPSKHSWLQFLQWGKQYGLLYRLNLAGTTHVIVCSEKVANDLCRERGNIYSDRPHFPMATKLLSNDFRPLLLPYGDTWRAFRKFTHGVANSAAAATYEPVQEEEALRLVHDLLQEPTQYDALLERYAASIIMRITYGTTIYSTSHPTLKRIKEVNHQLERVASPGAYLVDAFPSLMKLPTWLAPFKSEGNRLHREEHSLFRSLVVDVAARAARGDLSTEGTMTKIWLDTKEKYPAMTDPHAHYTLGTIFEAGADTTAAALMSFMLAMVLYPEKFDKVAAEVDSIVPDRLPSFADLPKLPYLRACI